METQTRLSSVNSNFLATFNLIIFLIAALAMPVAQASVESSSSSLPPTTAQTLEQAVQQQSAQQTVALADQQEGKALSQSEIIDQATSQSADAHVITKNKGGSVRIPSPMQDVIATLTPKGASIYSDDEAGETFALFVNGLGRDKGKLTKIKQGKIISDEKIARLFHNNLIEEFTTSSGGIQQDFVVPAAPKCKGKLMVELDIEGATARLDNKGAMLTLKSGRELAYHSLLVADAAGKTLAAHFAIKDEHTLRIIVDDKDAQYPVRIDPTITDADWFSMGTNVLNGSINALAWDGSNLYIGGLFDTVDGTQISNIAKWNGSSWSALGSGIDGPVYALAWYENYNTLYAGGNFNTAGGVPANSLARWSGTFWSAYNISSNVDNDVTVYAMIFIDYKLVVGGYFLIPYNNGLTIGGLQQGTRVRSLAWDESNRNLYVGGSILLPDGLTHTNIAKLYIPDSWNGIEMKSWVTLGSGVNNSVDALAWDGSNLYVGGNFTTAGDKSANYIAQWDGTNWNTLGSGMNDRVRALTWDGSNLYAGGDFTIAGGTSSNYISQWNGSNWNTLGSGMDNGINALAWNGTTLYAAGVFTTAGDKTTLSHVAGVNFTAPNPLVFTDLNDVALNTQLTSSIQDITALAGNYNISITGGEYSLNSGAFTSAAGTAVNGDNLQLRTTSSSINNDTTNVAITIGNYNNIWNVTTLTDTIPNAFNFTNLTNAPIGSLVTSNTFVVTGLGASSPISITGGNAEYIINSTGGYSNLDGFINNNDTVAVRTTSSYDHNTTADVVLTIGGISSTYTVTTISDGGSGGDGGGGSTNPLLLSLLSLFVISLRRRVKL